MHFKSAAALETLSQLLLQSLSPDPDPRRCRRLHPRLRSRRPQRHLRRPLRREDPPRRRGPLQEPCPLSLDPLPLRRRPPHPRRREEPDQSPHCLPHAQSPPLHPSPAASVPNSPRPSPSSVPTTSPWPGPPSSPSSSPTSAPPPTTPPSTASSAPPPRSSSSSATPSTRPPSASTSSTASTASPPPLPEVFVKAAQFISANATASSPDVLCPFFECQRLCCRIFHSLNSIELREFFDDHMREWMTEFRSYLTTTNSPAVETEGTIDALRAAICENLQLKMNKNEEEFKDYLKDFYLR